MNSRLVPMLSLLVGGAGPALAEPSDEPPRLVILLVIDQLRRDRLDPELPGGLGRLAREGRVYRDAVLDHARSETCPGHMSIATGRHPGPAGVPGNSHVSRELGREVYCVADDSEGAAVFGGKGGRSPKLLDASALGDWLKQADPEARVFTVSGKDRSAIALGGQHPDGAYWYSRKAGFTSSRYYTAALPKWLVKLNKGLETELPEQWEHGREPGVHPDRPDDFEGESPDYSRSSPHPLRGDDKKETRKNLYFTPSLDLLTLRIARELVERHELGADEHPDLLGIGLSGSDTIGHLYGPGSHESRAQLLEIDRAFGELLAAIEARVGAGRVLVALSADHGVLPLPEWLAHTGRAECPAEGGRIGLKRLALGLFFELHTSLAPLLSLPDEWVLISGNALTVNRTLAAEHGVPVERVIEVAKTYLEGLDGIQHVWTEAELADSDDPIARLYRNSHHPDRGGDLLVQVEPGCLISGYDHGTSHGSPYLYDRAVPIVFWGPGIPASQVTGPAATIDIAPSLAARLGIATPDDLDGRALLR
jgi:predicted AlkP superfamily pyrophosphatase or phosphodiesterase